MESTPTDRETTACGFPVLPGAQRTGQDGGLAPEVPPRPAAAPQDQERVYFVIGQWRGGGDVDIWHVEEAPADPGERSDRCDEHREAADDAFGSVEIVYATSPEAAAERARREARATSERIHREADRP
ncbi:hypothetical protein [Streptomyces hokutonensis]|uniref:hypothetical protein n=1 Tax=Streptomyces hokutonensis TaxID=1306990 RepID=UPI00380EAF11